MSRNSFLPENVNAKRIADTIDTMRDDIVSFIQTLVRTPSLPGEERNVQQKVADKLNSLGFDVTTIPIQPKELQHHPAFCDDGYPAKHRTNVIGLWKGTGKGEKGTGKKNNDYHSLILNGHMDVVSPGDESLWDESPWSGAVKNGRLYGRGSADMKAGLSAAVFACQVLRKLGFQPQKDVLIQSVAGEETGGCGTLTNIVNGCTADAAIIMEPTELKIYPIQSGALSFRIKITGKAIHACMKNLGVSAIEKFYAIFQAIEAFEKQRHQAFHNPVYQDRMNVAPINVGVLESGDWPSTVPDQLTAEGRCGVFPGESTAAAKQAFEDTVRQAALADDWLKDHLPEVEWFEGQFEAGETAMDEPVIQTLAQCHETMLGKKVAYSGATYGSDLRLFTNHAGIPAVLYGPGDVKDAHTVNESIDIDEIMDAVKVLAVMIPEWCGGGFPS